MNGMVSIPVDLYLELVDDQEELYALYEGGVGNWEGYDNAVANLNREDDE